MLLTRKSYNTLTIVDCVCGKMDTTFHLVVVDEVGHSIECLLKLGVAWIQVERETFHHCELLSQLNHSSQLFVYLCHSLPDRLALSHNHFFQCYGFDNYIL